MFLGGSKGCDFRLEVGRKAYSELPVSHAPWGEEHDVYVFFLCFLEEKIFIHWSGFKSFWFYFMFLFFHRSAPPGNIEFYQIWPVLSISDTFYSLASLFLKPIWHHLPISVSSSNELFTSLRFPVRPVHLTYPLMVLFPDTAYCIPTFKAFVFVQCLYPSTLQCYSRVTNISFYVEQSCYKNIKIQL